MPDELGIKGSFIIVLLDSFERDPTNLETKLVELRI